MSQSARSAYAGYRFPSEIIGHAVWLYFRFPLSLRMVEEMLAARGIAVSHDRAYPRGDALRSQVASPIARSTQNSTTPMDATLFFAVVSGLPAGRPIPDGVPSTIGLASRGLGRAVATKSDGIVDYSELSEFFTLARPPDPVAAALSRLSEFPLIPCF